MALYKSSTLLKLLNMNYVDCRSPTLEQVLWPGFAIGAVPCSNARVARHARDGHTQALWLTLLGSNGAG